MSRASIDITVFTAHSARAASTSKAKENSIPIEDILKKAGWSSVKTFAQFYDKKIINSDQCVDGLF